MRATSVQWFVRERPAEAPAGPRRFHDHYTFIDLRPAHLDFMRVIYGTNVPSIDECVGRTMVSEHDFMPLGCVVVWLEPDHWTPRWEDAGEIGRRRHGQWDAGEIGARIKPGRNWLYADFGRWLKIWPKDILRAMAEVTDRLRAAEIFILHASANQAVEGSDYLLKWLGAEPTGEHEEGLGPIYKLDLRNCKI